MDLSLLQKLKEKMATAKEFSDVWNYFFDHFGENPEFIKLGEPTEHPFLQQVFAQVCARLFTVDAVLMTMMFTRVAEHHFIHGCVTLNGRLASVMYFEDVQLGMMFVAAPKPGGNNDYVRFSGRLMPPHNAKPSLN